MDDLIDTPAQVNLRATRDDIRQIVRVAGGNNKKRSELGLMRDGVTDAIRAAQGHIHQCGVRGDVLPAAEYLETLIHGATLATAKMIADGGIHRRDRLHVHLRGSDMAGRPLDHRNKRRASSDVVIAVSAGKCERYGIIFY